MSPISDDESTHHKAFSSVSTLPVSSLFTLSAHPYNCLAQYYNIMVNLNALGAAFSLCVSSWCSRRVSIFPRSCDRAQYCPECGLRDPAAPQHVEICIGR